MPNVMAALPNIGGALCSTPQSLTDAHYTNVSCSNAAKTLRLDEEKKKEETAQKYNVRICYAGRP